MEFHPDPAEEEGEMRPLHLVPRNVPGEGGGGSGGGKEDREGETVWKFVALASCRAGFLFSWRSKMGAEGLATRPADASSGEGGREASSESQVTGLSLPNPAFFSTFPPPCWAQDHQRSEKDVGGPPSHATPSTSNILGRTSSGQGHLATMEAWAL